MRIIGTSMVSSSFFLRTHIISIDPDRGHAFRSILVENGRVDNVLLEAGARAKINDVRNRISTGDVSMWCSPGIIQVQYFVKNGSNKMLTIFQKNSNGPVEVPPSPSKAETEENRNDSNYRPSPRSLDFNVRILTKTQ